MSRTGEVGGKNDEQDSKRGYVCVCILMVHLNGNYLFFNDLLI